MRRRRTRYTWFPTDPTYYGDTPATYYWTYIEPGEVLALPVVPDQTYQDETITSADNKTLRDYVEGQDYVLKRIVGKVWGALEQSDQAEATNIIQVIHAQGLAVLPVNDTTPSTPALDPTGYDPLNPTNSMNPWIWRRTWILGNNLHPQFEYGFPNNVGAYGSVMDGGHVDSKVARRVTREQRLWWVTTMRVITQSGEGPTTQRVMTGFDLRTLGAMRKHRNRSTFA